MTSMPVFAAVLLAAAGALAQAEDPASLLKKTGYSLAEAIAKASKESGGSSVVVAELEEGANGKALYAVEFAQGAKVLEVKLDARTGELVKKEIEEEDRSAVVKACKVPLGQALETALQKVPGQAFAAEARIEHEKPEIEVQILSEGKIYKVEIDGVSGAVTKVKTRKTEKSP